MAELTLKQQRFADEYISSGNAYQSAIKAGYSENYSKGNVSKLLGNVRVKNYIDERLKKIESEKTANQQEVIEYLSSVMRGEQTEEVLKNTGVGIQEITNIKVSAKDRLKAANILNNIYQSREKQTPLANQNNIIILDEWKDE